VSSRISASFLSHNKNPAFKERALRFKGDNNFLREFGCKNLEHGLGVCILPQQWSNKIHHHQIDWITLLIEKIQGKHGRYLKR